MGACNKCCIGWSCALNIEYCMSYVLYVSYRTAGTPGLSRDGRTSRGVSWCYRGGNSTLSTDMASTEAACTREHASTPLSACCMLAPLGPEGRRSRGKGTGNVGHNGGVSHRVPNPGAQRVLPRTGDDARPPEGQEQRLPPRGVCSRTERRREREGIRAGSARPAPESG